MTFLLTEDKLLLLKKALEDTSVNGLVLSLAIDDAAKVFITIAPATLSSASEEGTPVKVLKYAEDDVLAAIPDPPGGH